MTNGDRFNQGVADRIDEILQAAVEQGQAPGVVAAVASGDAVHVAAAGVMAAGGPAMRPDTVFRIPRRPSQ
jgi:CubicO group peptidase (beta-lactamase class C family)